MMDEVIEKITNNGNVRFYLELSDKLEGLGKTGGAVEMQVLIELWGMRKVLWERTGSL